MRRIPTPAAARARFLAVAALLSICLLVAAALASGGLRDLSGGSDGTPLREPIPYLGVTYVPLSHELATRYGVDAGIGVLVTDVADGSPARAAGLRRGDILLSADSAPLTPARSLVALLIERRPGDRVSLQLMREGRTLTAELVLGAKR